jgi:HD superfamily phosphohydrolase
LNRGSSSSELLESLRAFAEAFAGEQLGSYVEELKRPGVLSGSPKEINDAVWGTIKLLPLEVAILDSPLLQRLRFVRQLGVVHWIYPGAIHTRFEHTLGVLHQTQQLVTAINGASPASHPAPVDNNYSSILRLCALLHDVGHGVFSHVSEHALIRTDQLRLALSAFAREQQISKVQLSELVAFYIIGSRHFREILEVSLDRLGNPINLGRGAAENAAEIIKKIQNAIIGKAISDLVPLLHELISGPIDADKLDYFVRDARLAGIPSTLDISRLTQKIAVQVIPQRDLPRPISSKVSGQHQSYYLFGLKWSGAAVLDELHLARILLYAKIYRHQKVLAAEAMVEALFEALGQAWGAPIPKLVQLAYRYTDDQLLWAKPQELLDLAGIENITDLMTSFVGDTLANLRARRLFVNALSVRPTYPGDPWIDFEPQVKGLRAFVERLSNPVDAREIKAKLVAEIKAIVEKVPDCIPASYKQSFIPHSVVISAKGRLSGGTEIDRAFIFQGGKPVTYRDLSGVNRPAWADAYDFSAASALIFCPRELAAAAYIGAEKLLRLDYNVILPSAAIELSKQNKESIEALKRRLEGAGYYDGAPYDLRAVPDRLGKADIPAFLDSITSKFEAFDEPIVNSGQRRPLTLRDRISYWLSQFRDEGSIECAMQIVRSMRILGREDTRAALLKFVEQKPEFRGATIVLLGGLKDSSAVQLYYSRDVEETFPIVSTVEDAAAKNIEAPLVFLDDFTGSGNQVQDVLGNWFNVEELKKEALKEQRELFGEKEREYIRSRKVAFVFVAGWNDGVEGAREACEKLGLDATVYAHITESEIPFAFENCLGDFEPEIQSRFEEQCRNIGFALVRGEGKEEEVAHERALGYGNRAMLLVSRYNVPTQVLTCLWKGGQADGVEWQPLIVRRPKK